MVLFIEYNPLLYMHRSIGYHMVRKHSATPFD